MPATSPRVALGRGFEALRLLTVVTLVTGYPLIVPMPGKVDADHSGSVAAALQHDDGLGGRRRARYGWGADPRLPLSAGWMVG